MLKNLEIGTRFSKLVTIGESFRLNNKTYVTCKCDCGNIKDLNVSAMKRGNIKSCGCLKKEINKTERDLLWIGKKFNSLTIIEECDTRAKENKPRYLCKCDCGNDVVVSLRNLKDGLSTSCGCSRRKWKNAYDSFGNRKRIYSTWKGMVQRCHMDTSIIYRY